MMLTHRAQPLGFSRACRVLVACLFFLAGSAAGARGEGAAEKSAPTRGEAGPGVADVGVAGVGGADEGGAGVDGAGVVDASSARAPFGLASVQVPVGEDPPNEGAQPDDPAADDPRPGSPGLEDTGPADLLPATPDPSSAGSESERPVLTIRRVEDAGIEVDGVLDEAVWTRALTLPLAYEWFPGEGVAPPVETEVLLLYDDENLYLAFVAHDPRPEEIRAHLMDRDNIETFVQDDHVAFTIDTFDDQRRGFQFRVNPWGVQADAIFSTLDGEDFSWDIVWLSAAKIGQTGWVAEIAIPFQQLRFPQTEEVQTWGFDFGRSYPRSVRHRMAANVIARDNNCLLCQAPRITGFENLESGLNLEVAPSLTIDRTDRAPFGGGDLESGDEEAEAGLSVRWSPSSSLTFNATVNPDFSQVEADAAQLEVNERFALFFPEKRPFFLEGVDFFSSQIPIVFTRTIVDPDWGLKLTGKSGANAFGLFTASDERNSFLLPANDGSDRVLLDEEVLTTVGRWRRDIGEASTLGVLYSGRESDSYHNRVAGVDGYFRLDERNLLQVQAVVSDTLYPDEVAATFGQERGSFGGHALEVLHFYGSDNWFGSAGYRTFSRDFRSDAGFVPRVDFETWRGQAGRNFWGGDDDWYTQIQVSGLVIDTTDQDGRTTDRKLELSGTVLGPKQSIFDVFVARQDQIAGDILFEDLKQVGFELEMQPTGSMRFEIEGFVGEDVDFDNDRRADAVYGEFELELKLGARLNAQAEWALEELEVEQGQRLFTANLVQGQLVYQFDTRTFLRGIFQYLDLDFAPELYRDFQPRDTEQLFSQLLFSYKINPQTVLFLGYSDSRRGVEGSSLEAVDRTFFFKIGYAWIR